MKKAKGSIYPKKIDKLRKKGGASNKELNKLRNERDQAREASNTWDRRAAESAKNAASKSRGGLANAPGAPRSPSRPSLGSFSRPTSSSFSRLLLDLRQLLISGSHLLITISGTHLRKLQLLIGVHLAAPSPLQNQRVVEWLMLPAIATDLASSFSNVKRSNPSSQPRSNSGGGNSGGGNQGGGSRFVKLLLL